LIVATLAATPCFAQDLTVIVTGDLANGGSVTWDLAGAPADTPTVVLVSMNDTGFSLGSLLTLDIGPVVLPVGFGSTDAKGDLSHTLNFGAVPMSAASSFGPLTFHSQTASLSFMPIGFTVSDAETATVN
ncbi:MAG: hypothetical protein KDB53_18780, partial [Planctomycetes bacterium]|nr:hypothetical protein [Planctomycetota bacterium]